MTVIIHGAKELRKAIKDLPAAAEGRGATRGVRRAAVIMRRETKAAAPIRNEKPLKPISSKLKPSKPLKRVGGKGGGMRFPGYLKQWVAFYKRRLPKGTHAVSYVVNLRKLSFYGYLLEFGTRHMPGRPWFTPVFHRNQHRLGEVIEGEMWKAIDLEWKKGAPTSKTVLK